MHAARHRVQREGNLRGRAMPALKLHSSQHRPQAAASGGMLLATRTSPTAAASVSQARSGMNTIISGMAALAEQLYALSLEGGAFKVQPGGLGAAGA